jgi:hypothetical protein
MTINNADFTISYNSGTSAYDIRHTGAGTTIYSVLDLHAWLQDLADNATTTGSENLSILSANPSKLDGPRDATVASRLNLINSFNIDDTTAQYFQSGSIKQASGNTLYSGVKAIGNFVAGSPFYVVQNGAKLTSWWAAGSLQTLIKVKVGGAWINSTIAGGATGTGYITVFSRKWGQTFSHFDVDMKPGGENAAAMSTAVDPAANGVTQATALGYGSGDGTTTPKITVAPTTAQTGINIGDGVTGNYTGTITISPAGSLTVQQIYLYLQAICADGSAVNVGTTPGYMFRGLSTFPENTGAPFGSFAGGKMFFAQGWYVTGLAPADALNYVLTDNAGTTHQKPAVGSIQVANLSQYDYVLVGRDSGTDMITNEYTVNGATTSSTTVTMNTTIKADTPASGIIRIAGVPYAYTSWSGSTFTFAAAQSIANGASAWVPFIDTSISNAGTGQSVSASFTFSAGFNFRIRVRSGTGTGGSTPIIPFETTVAASSGAASVNVVRTADV